jgi:hypothetical protein
MSLGFHVPVTLLREGAPGVHGTENTWARGADLEATGYIRTGTIKKSRLPSPQRVTVSNEFTAQ